MRFLRSRLTARGWGLLALGALLFGAAWVARQPDLTWPGLFLMFLPLVSWLVIPLITPTFKPSRSAHPPVVSAGDEVRMEFTAEVTRPPIAGRLYLSDEVPNDLGGRQRFSMPAFARGQVARHAYPVRPPLRGRPKVTHVTNTYRDPLGLAQSTAKHALLTELLVLPKLVPLPSTVVGASGRDGETPIPQTIVAGPDDVMVREYQPRDDYRRIHWPSTARMGELMVRREEQAWDPSAWLVLDNRASVHPRGLKSSPSFEWLVSLCASVGAQLADAGYVLHLTDASGDTWSTQAHDLTERKLALLNHLVDADLVGEPSLVEASRAVSPSTEGHLVVAFLGRLDVDTARHLVEMHDAHQQCRALVIEPDAAARPAYERGADLLHRFGWRVASVGVDQDAGGAWASLSLPGVAR